MRNLIKFFSTITIFILFSIRPVSAAEPIHFVTFEASPYVSTDPQNPGLLYEIVRAASNAGGLNPIITIQPVNRARKEASENRGRALFPTVTEAHDHYLYSESLFSVRQALLRSKNASDQKHPPVGSPYVYDGESIGTLVDMVNKGRARSHFVDPFVTAELIVTRRSSLLTELEIQSTTVSHVYRIGIPRHAPRAKVQLAAFHEGLKKIKASGQYEDILEKYGYPSIVSRPKTLHIVAPNNHDTRDMKELSTEFSKVAPGTTIKWHFMSEALLRKRTALALLLDFSNFDIMSLEAVDLISHRGSRAIAPIDQDLVRTARFDDMYPAVRYAIEWEGKVYALPYRVYTNVTYFRKDLFKKKNLSMPSSPRWDQLESFAKTLNNIEEGVVGFCMSGRADDPEVAYILRSLFFTQDRSFTNAMLKPEIDKAPIRAVMRRVTDLLLQHGPPKPYNSDDEDNLQRFRDGRCAIWLASSIAAEEIFDENLSRIHDKAGVTDPPYLSDEPMKRRMHYRNFSVSAYSSHKRLAQTYLVWTLSRDYEKLLLKRKGWLHVRIGLRPSLIRSGELTRQLPHLKPLMATFENFGFTYGTNPISGVERKVIQEALLIWPSFAEIIGQAFSNILKKEVSVEEAMMQAERKLKAAIYQSRNNP